MPTRTVRCAFAAILVSGLSLASGLLADDAKDKPKTNDVKIKKITLAVPESWKPAKPSSNLRLAQFDMPLAEGDSAPTELVVSSFGGGGGGLEQNLPRWTGEFVSEGRTMKITTGKSPQGEYSVVDVTGTHLGTSFAKRPKPLEKARLLVVVLVVPEDGHYFLKLVGPEKTVAAQADALRASFGGNAKEEKDYKAAAE